MKKKASINYFFPTLLFIIFIFAGLTSFLQLFGFCAAHFDVLADSLVLAIVFCLVYVCVRGACQSCRALHRRQLVAGGEIWRQRSARGDKCPCADADRRAALRRAGGVGIVFAVLRRAAKAAALFRRARCERALDPAPLRMAQKIVQ